MRRWRQTAPSPQLVPGRTGDPTRGLSTSSVANTWAREDSATQRCPPMGWWSRRRRPTAHLRRKRRGAGRAWRQCWGSPVGARRAGVGATSAGCDIATAAAGGAASPAGARTDRPDRRSDQPRSASVLETAGQGVVGASMTARSNATVVPDENIRRTAVRLEGRARAARQILPGRWPVLPVSPRGRRARAARAAPAPRCSRSRSAAPRAA